ncbi:MAG TPA: ABC transporter permease [Lacunisphaera sp.]|jgi:ABC-2 type transport system permease protein|nr:ABC transporter permease [Lacunisphaera sp.]
MRILLTLLGKDFANLRRNRGALMLTFIVPMVIIYIVGLVFGLGRSDSGPSGIPLAVVDQSGNPAGQKLVEALRAQKAFHLITDTEGPDHRRRPLTEADLRPMIENRNFSYALVIPPDLVSENTLGLHLKILSDPRNDIEAQTVNGLLQKTIFTSVPQLLGQALRARAGKFLGAPRLKEFDHSIAAALAKAFGGDADAIERDIAQGKFGLDEMISTRTGDEPGAKAEAGDLLSRFVKIDSEQVVGRDVKSPAATRIIGGYAVMFLLFALSNSAAAFFDEQNAGLFERLLSTPVSRAQLLWSRFLYGVLFGLTQLMVLFIAGHFLYGVDVYSHLGSLLLVCATVAGACTGFGMLVAAITRSAEAARSLATLLVITMSACGGAWFPVSFMPEFMQHIARFTIVYWSIEGFGAVLWAGNSFTQLLPIIGILASTTAAVMIVAVWRFNRNPLFE